jgi:hypothetical protein
MQLAVSYPAGQSSVHRARPRDCVSYWKGMVGWCSYVEQRLNTRGVLSGLCAC